MIRREQDRLRPLGTGQQRDKVLFRSKSPKVACGAVNDGSMGYSVVEFL